MCILDQTAAELVFQHLPRVGPKQLCVVAHLGCTREADTFYLISKLGLGNCKTYGDIPGRFVMTLLLIIGNIDKTAAPSKDNT